MILQPAACRTQAAGIVVYSMNHGQRKFRPSEQVAGF
jgi:hypothetical protein